MATNVDVNTEATVAADSSNGGVAYGEARIRTLEQAMVELRGQLAREQGLRKETKESFRIARALLSNSELDVYQYLEGESRKHQREIAAEKDKNKQLTEEVRLLAKQRSNWKKAADKMRETKTKQTEELNQSKLTMEKLEGQKANLKRAVVKIRNEKEDQKKEIERLQAELDQFQAPAATSSAPLQGDQANPLPGPSAAAPPAAAPPAPAPPAAAPPAPAPPAAAPPAGNDQEAAAAAAAAARAQRFFTVTALANVVNPLKETNEGLQIRRVPGNNNTFRLIKAKLDQGTLTTKAALVKEISKGRLGAGMCKDETPQFLAAKEGVYEAAKILLDHYTKPTVK